MSRVLKDVATGIRQLQCVQTLQVQSNGVLDQLIRCGSLGHGGDKSQFGNLLCSLGHGGPLLNCVPCPSTGDFLRNSVRSDAQ